MNENTSPGLTWGLAALALGLFLPLFWTGGLGSFDFWWWMAANAALLTGLCAALDPGWRRSLSTDLRSRLVFKLALGLGSAVFLYGVFFAGNLAARWMFSFAAGGIDAVYHLKEGSSPLIVGLLIGILIGPAEELFWRAFLQRRLADRHGPWIGLMVSAALYTGMHMTSANPMLVLAAGVCGLFWGWLYLRYRSMVLNVTSHVVWDLAVFLFFPYGA